MKSPKILLIILSFLILLTLACAISGPATPEPEPVNEDLITTSVAKTLAANEASQEAITPPTEAPTEKPAPTPTTQPKLQVPYILNGYLWLWTEGGTAKQLSGTGNVTNLTISEDGLVIAFEKQLSHFDYEIWTVNSDGTHERRIFSVEDFQALPKMEGAVSIATYQLGWVPNTHTLAFNTRPLFEGPGLTGDNNLHLINTDTGDHTILLPNGEGGAFHYSPDGTQIAIVTPENISFVNADGSNRREMLTYPVIYTYSEYSYYPTPLWMPDSSAALVAIPPQDSLGNPNDPTALWNLPADGSPVSLVRNVITAPAFLSRVSFSPDGKYFAYLVSIGEETSNLRDLHIAALDGASDTVYQTGSLWFSGWSPNAARFIFSIDDPSNLHVGQIGNAPKKLTDTPLARDVRWITNNDILFVAGGAGNWEIRRGTPGDVSYQIVNLGEEYPIYDFSY